MGQTNYPKSLRRLGDFEMLCEIGRGGMGVVHEARQVSLNRKVALKVLSGELGLTSKAVQRFRREAEAAERPSAPFREPGSGCSSKPARVRLMAISIAVCSE
jgi:serine/threonine protein kinase